MMIKRVCAMLLALVMCTGVFSTTAFAYSNETVSAADVTEATEPEETESAEEQTEKVKMNFLTTSLSPRMAQSCSLLMVRNMSTT